MKYLKTTILATGISLLVAGAAKAQNSFPSTGNVGIGTTSAAQLLHLYGNNPRIFIEGDAGSYYSGLQLKSPMIGEGVIDNYGAAALWGGVHITTYTTPTGGLRVDLGATTGGIVAYSADPGVVTSRIIGAYGQTANVFQAGRNTSAVPGVTVEGPDMVLNSAGNLGLGTTTPGAKLHVAGTFKLVDGTQGLGKVLTSDANGVASWQTATGGSTAWTDAGSGNIYTTVLGGKVGIGVAAVPTGFKMAVAGAIIAERVKVKLQSAGWPDYVFKTGYGLPSLKEVELYIRANSHLPGVPSATEVEKSGLDLGDNQAVLLKKIEELTLYMIDMNKKMDRLATENETIKKQLAARNNE